MDPRQLVEGEIRREDLSESAVAKMFHSGIISLVQQIKCKLGSFSISCGPRFDSEDGEHTRGLPDTSLVTYLALDNVGTVTVSGILPKLQASSTYFS